jgi:hypothetical protein
VHVLYVKRTTPVKPITVKPTPVKPDVLNQENAKDANEEVQYMFQSLYLEVKQSLFFESRRELLMMYIKEHLNCPQL